ncbi:MAG: hypothetical protein RI996_596 [Candidatus Parcubacteria bacterium]|jgi:peroxiredoxin (alkyl hydroperoxide reductase subunit C)
MSECLRIGALAPDFTMQGFWRDDVHTFRLSDYRSKWVVVFFYPGDFTFVCPTELEDLAKQYETFTKLNVEILAVSTDSVYVHKAWKGQSPAIGQVVFPMLSDSLHIVSKKYGVYSKEEGTALRGTFLIDEGGILRTMEIHDNGIGRSVGELLRKVQAAQYVSAHPGTVCPASWQPGDETLVPSVDIVDKI